MQKYLSWLLLLCSLCSTKAQHLDKIKFVNLFIGTGGHGHTHPAAMVPNGMVQPGPDTRMHGWDACSGYYYADSTINGFTQNRLSGTGCADLSDFLLMPIIGKADLHHNQEKTTNNQCPYASDFLHNQEVAEPGYYSVFLNRYGIKSEITATERAAFYRFTYQRPGPRGMIIDLDYNNQDQYMLDFGYKAIGDTILSLYHRSLGWAYDQPAYAYIKFSKPFNYRVVSDTVYTPQRAYPCCKLILQFPTLSTDTLLVKLGFSYVDESGANLNLACEMPGWNFNGVRGTAQQLWEDALDKIDISNLGKAANDSDKTIFYTALYHANIAPHLFSDVNGNYRGMDGKIHQCDLDDPVYTVFSLWDTHRALHPLLSIISPEKNEAYLRSLIRKGEEGGIVPKWELTGNYTACMIGYHFASLLADAYTKGNYHYNISKAYHQALRVAKYDTAHITSTLPRWKMNDLMPIARYYKNHLKYIPCDKESESVAKGLEYAYDDWCIAQLAKSLGDSTRFKIFKERALYYKNYFDPQTKFMRGKDSKGDWRKNFDPLSSDHRRDDYTEGNAWQWTWFVPHDPQGLMHLFGNKKIFLKKLDSLFTIDSHLRGQRVSPDISGMIGQYAHGNEPSHHIIYLYNYMGEPWKAQALADKILRTQYANRPDGLSGNEDCGQMSAWYLLNAMGFYQPCPGKPIYTIARPLFETVTLYLPQQKTFTIQTIHNSTANKYVKRVTLNGKKLNTPFFTHKQLMQGGKLVIEMCNKPTKWGKIPTTFSLF